MALPRRSGPAVRAGKAAADAVNDQAGRAGVAALAREIASVPLSRSDLVLCRAVRSKYLKERNPPEPLYCKASARSGARFTPIGGPAGLYLATDQITAFAEIQDLYLDQGGRPLPLEEKEDVTLVYVRTRVSGILDLTDASVLDHLGVSHDAVAADWRGPMEEYIAGRGPLPFTQQIGQAAHITGRVRGIWYPSVRFDHGRCLCVFPDRLSRTDGDFVSVGGLHSQRLP